MKKKNNSIFIKQVTVKINRLSIKMNVMNKRYVYFAMQSMNIPIHKLDERKVKCDCIFALPYTFYELHLKFQIYMKE